MSEFRQPLGLLAICDLEKARKHIFHDKSIIYVILDIIVMKNDTRKLKT